MTTAMVDAQAGTIPRPERVAAMLAMASFVVCSILGQLLVLWWARRHESLHARRYAWASLALEGVMIAVVAVYGVVFFLTSSSTVNAYTALVGWLLQLALCLLAVVLAVRAWRGLDLSNAPLPSWLKELLP